MVQREPISLADALGDEELPVKMAYVPMADTGRQQRTMGRGLPWLCHKCGSWLLSHLVIWLLRLLSCLWARLLAYLLSRTLPVGLTVSPPPPFWSAVWPPEVHVRKLFLPRHQNWHQTVFGGDILRSVSGCLLGRSGDRGEGRVVRSLESLFFPPFTSSPGHVVAP